MRFVVGLGNPGRRYVRTRHNLGWRVVDAVASALDIQGERECWHGLAAWTDEVTLFKPLTHMNQSGRAVAKLVRETAVCLDDLLVVLDDLNLPLGTVRMRARGSAGGHRGLQSVIDWLQTDVFPRLRLGIGPATGVCSGREFVLSPFEEAELPVVDRMLGRAALAVQCWLKEGVQAAMSRYNGAV